MRRDPSRPRRSGAGAAVVALGAVALLGTIAVRELTADGSGAVSKVRAPRVPKPPRPRAARPVVAAEDVVVAEVDAASVVEVASEAAAEPLLVQRALRIVGPEGRPISGIPVEGSGASCKKSATNGEGLVTFLVRPGDSLVVEFRDGRSPRSMTLTSPLTEAVVAGLPEAEVVTIDATTGLPIEPCGTDVTVWCDATHTDLEFAAGDAVRFPLPLEDDGETGLWISARAPAGSASLRRLTWEGRVAPRARRVRVTAPVFPEETWTLRAVDAEGRPCAGVRAADVDFVAERGSEATRYCGAEETSDTSGTDGRIVVRGVPRIPLGRAKFELQRGSRWNDEDAATRLRGLSATVALDGGGASGALDVVVAPWDGSSSHMLSCGWGCSSGSGRLLQRSATTARLTVRALDVSGRAAAGVRVRAADRAATTDERGVAVIEKVPAGETSVVAFEHGFVPTAVVAVVGRDAEVLIQEKTPRRVRVTVVDPGGRSVPSVRVLPTCEAIPGETGEMIWARTTVAQLVGDLELATPRTDAAGVVELDVPRGRIRYDATLIGAAASHTTSDDDVRIVLRPPGE